MMPLAVVTALGATLLGGCSNKPGRDQPLFAPPAKVMDSREPANSANPPDWRKRMTVTRIQVWWQSGAIIYPSDGVVKSVDAESAVYYFKTGPRSWDAARDEAVVFINPSTKHVWAGPRTGYYLDTPDGIVGMEVLPGDVRFCDSGFRDLHPGDTLDSLARRFEQQKLYLRLLDWPIASCNPTPSDFVEPDFFCARPGASNPGEAHVTWIRLHGQTLDLTLDSPTYAYQARLLFDIKSRSLTKGIYDSGMETPPSILQHLVNDIPQLRPRDPEYGVCLNFDVHSVTGYYRLHSSPSTQPADGSDHDLSVTLSWYERDEQAKNAFAELIASRGGNPPATQPDSQDEDTGTCPWPDGRLLQRQSNRLIDINPEVPIPKDLPDAILQACLRRWATGQSRQ
jgi:hypothetical protein